MAGDGEGAEKIWRSLYGRKSALRMTSSHKIQGLHIVEVQFNPSYTIYTGVPIKSCIEVVVWPMAKIFAGESSLQVVLETLMNGILYCILFSIT